MRFQGWNNVEKSAEEPFYNQGRNKQAVEFNIHHANPVLGTDLARSSRVPLRFFIPISAGQPLPPHISGMQRVSMIEHPMDGESCEMDRLSTVT